jgi:ABC-type uncharacterized transport system involved in gliding motility auxiliary subunit
MNANLLNTIKLILGTLGFLGLLIAAQAIFDARNRRLDLTPERKFTLSPRTQQVVKSLKKDVYTLAFINSDRPENFFIEDTLDRMARLSSRFHYDIIDMNRNPALARQYNAVQYGTLVFESDGQRRGMMFSSGESAVVSTLLQVTRGEKVIYLVTGHGEGELTNSNPQEGLTILSGAFADEFYEVKRLSLAGSGAVPEDAAVVVLLGPKAEFLPAELDVLDAYIQRGGAVLVLLDPQGSPSLPPFLEKYGVYLPPLVAVDPTKNLYAGEIITFRTSATARQHPIILSVNAPPIFSLARVVEVHQDRAKGIIVSDILATSGEGWGTAGENITKEGTATFVAGRDTLGPVPIAGEVTLQKGEGVGGRIVVFGDADLATNALIDYGGNRDLLINAVNWLAEDVPQIGERPERQKSGVHQFFLSAEQGRRVLVLGTVVFPGIFLLAGVGIFVWRRQRG